MKLHALRARHENKQKKERLKFRACGPSPAHALKSHAVSPKAAHGNFAMLLHSKKQVLWCAAAALLLSACSQGTGENTPSPTPPPSVSVTATTPATEPTPYEGAVNPLTGLPIEEELTGQRPIAVMINNLKAALPQLGVSQADILYEVLAEGGITRMLAVYQSVEGVELIGSVRSARTYYLELALGHDAIYLHAGGSPDAYSKIKAWGVTAFDCVNGPYEGTLFWRDPDRIRNNGRVHSVVTSGEAIGELLPTYGVRLEHEQGYSETMHFAPDGTPDGGAPAGTITVPFSNYKTGVFTYDPETGLYLVQEYGQAYIDGNTGEQVGVTNVLILKTDCSLIPGDSEGRLTVDLTSGGEGWYACGGTYIPILWEKGDADDPLRYITGTGQALELGAGKSYVNIVPLTCAVSFEE